MIQKYTICKSDWEALRKWRKQAEENFFNDKPVQGSTPCAENYY